jgi:RNA polymerase sigma factor (sigma-70 family)
MSMRISGAAIGELHTLFRWGAMGTWTDGQLMTQFLASQEGREAAFRVLIHRHGPMVLGVCRRILGDEHAAEDAFQATFLVLVKKAGTLRDRDLLTNWLYGVASRVANKERARGARRRLVERRAAEPSATSAGEIDQVELRSVIDEEIRRLPERYRVPLVLCHVEGLRHDEVAQRLGCPVGTVESRLSRARERLRSRLARRGLAPTASALGAVLQPPKPGFLLPSLVEPTVKAAIEHAADPAGIAMALISGLLHGIGRLVVGLYSRAGAVATTLVISTSVVAISLGVFPVAGETPPPSHRTPASVERLPVASPPPVIAQVDPDPPIASPPSIIAQEAPDPPRRSAFAIARPMAGITIDGRLDDWPKGLETYRIQRQVLDEPNYDSNPRTQTQDPDAYFNVGYDRQAGLIYLAVVVRDKDSVVHPASLKEPNSYILKTDAVEVYVDGTFSERNSKKTQPFNAATMPVLQYVGVPGNVPAYGDHWGANPSLLYSKIRERRTQMKYQREGDVTTYEWAVQAYDQYPDQLTQLLPGKRIGFDVAVVDKDSAEAPPAWMYWGPTWAGFKGWDASNLGELILAESP